jgi:hypothetical protein
MARASALALTKEEYALIDSIISEQQSDGKTFGEAPDKDFLLEDGNIDLWMLYYFPQDFLSWEPALNAPFFDMLENWNEGQARLPAQHGKTTMILDWFAYVFCRCPDVSAIYTEKNLPTAMQRSYSLMGKLQNDRLVHDFGDFKGEQWSTQAFTIRQRPRHIDTPTFRVYGAGGGSVLGQRCNIEVNDDPVTDENNASDKERESLFNWYTKAAATSPYPLPISNPRYKKKHFLVGTVFGLDDLYHRVARSQEHNPNYAFLHLKAVPDEEAGTTLSPLRFCYIDSEELKRKAEHELAYSRLLRKVETGDVKNLHAWRKANGTWAFYQRYQNIAIDRGAQKFPEIWFTGGKDEFAPPDGYPGCFDKSRSYGDREEGYVYFTGVDPASGGTGGRTVRFAAVTIGVNPKDGQGKVLVAAADYGKYPLLSDTPGKTTMTGLVLDQVAAFGSRVVLEVNNIQRVFYDAMQTEARKRGMSVQVSQHFTTQKKKVDFETGIDAMCPVVENGLLRLPHKRPSDQRISREIMEEMAFLGNYGTDDLVMALWLAWRVSERLRGHRREAYKPRQLPPYFQRGTKLNFPPQWTEEQRAAYLAGDSAEEVEET